MNKSIFTKIIEGEIPSYKIYEDEKTYAFFDIHPVTQGHVLVVPKNQVEFLWDLPDEDYLAVMKTSKKLAKHLRSKLNVPYIGEKVVGTDVPHAHVHLIPFSQSHEFHGRQDLDAEIKHNELSELCNKLLIK